MLEVPIHRLGCTPKDSVPLKLYRAEWRAADAKERRVPWGFSEYADRNACPNPAASRYAKMPLTTLP